MDHVAAELDNIQERLFERALEFRNRRTIIVDSYEEFKVNIEDGVFILAHWDRTPETEAKIKRGDQGYHPMHTFRRRHHSRSMHGDRQAFRTQGSLCKKLLISKLAISVD